VAAVDLETVIPAGASLLLDSSAVLAYLVGLERTSPLAVQVLDDFVATGRNPAGISAVTVGEVLVRPFRTGPAAVAIAEGFLRHFAELEIITVDYAIARESARIRALTGMRTPDALIVASALVAGVDIVVTNDRSWPGAVADVAPDLRVCRLDLLLE